MIVAFSDHQGQLIGKRTDGEFYLDVVAEEGTENCDYLIACDIEDVPIPGFRWASYDQGYGDMRGVVDPSTIRYLPWLDRTAVVLVDLVDVDTGAPVAVSPRRILQDQADKAAALGYVPMIGSEVEFFLFKETFDDANAAGYRGLTPNSPYLEDYHILQTTKEEDVLGAIRRGLRGAGFPVEFSKGEAGKGQHELNLTYQDRGRDGRHQPDLQERGEGDRRRRRSVGDVHGQAVLRRRRLELPHPLEPVGRRHVDQPDARAARRARRRTTATTTHHMSELFRWYLGGLIATAREFSLLFAPNPNSYKRFQPGSWAPTGIGWAVDNRTLGFRVVGHGNGMRVESRIPGADANCYHAFAATIAGGLYGIEQQIDPPPPYAGNGYTATDLARIPWNYPEAIELWRTSTIAKQCFGDDVHHHVLNHAEAEWLAFNQTVTDWERRRYFERI